jgi:hypothetical protein
MDLIKDRSTIVIGILFFLIFLPLCFLWEYKLQKMLNKKGIKIRSLDFGGNGFAATVNTDVFLGKKRTTWNYFLNFLGDLFFSFVYFVFVSVFIILSLFLALKIDDLLIYLF